MVGGLVSGFVDGGALSFKIAPNDESDSAGVQSTFSIQLVVEHDIITRALSAPSIAHVSKSVRILLKGLGEMFQGLRVQPVISTSLDTHSTASTATEGW